MDCLSTLLEFSILGAPGLRDLVPYGIPYSP